MRTRYVVSMNLAGLYQKEVTVCRPKPNWEGKTEWWNSNGDIDAPRLGLLDTGVILKFVTEDRKKADTYLMGVKSALKQISRYCNGWEGGGSH